MEAGIGSGMSMKPITLQEFADRIVKPAMLPLEKKALAENVEMLTNQLDGARYAFHKIARHKYWLAVQRMELTPEQGEEAYRKAMNNYDDVIMGCADGHFAEANARQMAEDLTIPYTYAAVMADG